MSLCVCINCHILEILLTDGSVSDQKLAVESWLITCLPFFLTPHLLIWEPKGSDKMQNWMCSRDELAHPPFSRWGNWCPKGIADDHVSDSYGTRSQITSVPIWQSFHYVIRLIWVTFLTQKLLRWYAGKAQVSFRALSKGHLFHKAFIDGPSPNNSASSNLP